MGKDLGIVYKNQINLTIYSLLWEHLFGWNLSQSLLIVLFRDRDPNVLFVPRLFGPILS